MLLLNNMNALIRIYSRLVTCAFLALSCAACFLFADLREGVTMLLLVACYIILFQGYQNSEATGIVYFGFLMLGLASMVCPQILWFVPIFWVMLATNLLLLTWRTWTASLLGLLTPFWFALVWMAYRRDFSLVTDTIHSLIDLQFPIRYDILGTDIMLAWGLLTLCWLTGTIHFLRKSTYDSIRIRLIYYLFIWTDAMAFALICFQPQHYRILLRVMIVNTAPLIGHFLALTSTKATNIAFVALTAITLIITLCQIWMLSFHY